MIKLIFLALIIYAVYTIFLSKVKRTLQFIELDVNDKGKPCAIFYSEQDNQYYEIPISERNADKWELQKGDKILVERNIKPEPSKMIGKETFEALWNGKDIKMKVIAFNS